MPARYLRFGHTSGTVWVFFLGVSLLLGAQPAAKPPTPAPKPVVCIDPGHPSEVGSGTKGTKTTELRIVWQVALLLRDRLEKQGVKVVMTKVREDQFVANKQRAETANKAKADLLIRLHCDAASGSGFATYYPAQQGTDREGRVGPSEEVIAKSTAAAKAFHPVVVAKLKGHLSDHGLRTDKQTAVGSRQGALTGSIWSEVPVILCEICVLTNPDDEAFIAEKKGRETMADALAAGVLAVLRPKG